MEMSIWLLLWQAHYQMLRNTILLPNNVTTTAVVLRLHSHRPQKKGGEGAAFFITFQPRTTQPEVTFSFSTNHFLQITLEVQLIFSVGLNLVGNVKRRKASIIQVETKRK